MRQPIPSLLALTAAVALTDRAQAQSTVQPDCLGSISDAASAANCINASTLPTPGMLLPLGPELFVNPTGEVGINTTTPEHTLDIAGELRASGRAAVGNDAGFGPVPNQYGGWDWLWDFSHVVTDLSSATSWAGLRSFVEFDPPIHQTGNDAKYVYSHEMIVSTAVGSDKDFEYMQGPYILALHEGTENMKLLAGALVGAENNHGKVDFQVGSYMISRGDWESTTVENSAAECQSGHAWVDGSITNDYSLYVYTPQTGGTLQNHYGIFLEDQDVGQQDSYALYSVGGKSYHEGDLGIGTDTPTAKLDVNGDFVASGTKSFVEPHPVDSTKEIRFVCLEGNEAGTYFRGDATLVGGEAVIEVPEEFRLVTEEEGLTVQVTALGPRAGLWVAERGLDRIVVRGERDVELSYFVNGVRKGYADFEVIRDRVARESNASKPEHGTARREVRKEMTRRLDDGR